MNFGFRPYVLLGCAFSMVLAVSGCCKDKTQDTPGETPAVASETPVIPGLPTKKPVSIKTIKIGESAEMSEFKLEAKEAKECKAKGYSRPKKDHKWIGVDVLIEATGTKELLVNQLSAKVTDSEGVVHNASYATQSSCGDHFKSARLNNGEKAKGWLIFEVPKAAKGFTMTYTERSYTESDAVKVELGL